MTHPVDLHAGQQLRRLRTRLGLTRPDLAKKVAVSSQQIEKYETAENRLSASRMAEFAAALGAQPGFFFKGLDGAAA